MHAQFCHDYKTTVTFSAGQGFASQRLVTVKHILYYASCFWGVIFSVFSLLCLGKSTSPRTQGWHVFCCMHSTLGELISQVLQLAQDNPKYKAIDRAIGKESFKVVTLLRLSPLLPLALSNYFYGITR